MRNGFITGVAEGEAELRVFTQDGQILRNSVLLKLIELWFIL